VSIDVNRARQLLPGKLYQYPPAQDKVPYKTATAEDLQKAGPTGRSILASIGGLSPAAARQMAIQEDRWSMLRDVMAKIEEGIFVPRVYVDAEGIPREYHVLPLSEYEATCEVKTFDSLSHALTFFYENKISSNRARQKSHDLIRAVSTALDKHYLKDQRLKEDLLAAENSEPLRLYGELLTANMHLLKSGMTQVSVTNYYDGTQVTIPLDPRYSPNKNAQSYFKRYGKAKTAIHEKKIQLEENRGSIEYLESVLSYLNNTGSIPEIEALREELEETGFLRRRKQKGPRKNKRFRPDPRKYTTSDGFLVLVGRNNRENDALTLQVAAKTDYWLHTKDIPGSHVIVRTEGKEITDTAILEAASIAAFHSKARSSGNVPVDYVRVRYVKKPAGAKPGMVIFTHNRTVYVDPKDPEASSSRP
jgi:predicted ribosome quality control (RQC) complex YloA/Tae2 family protein